MTGGRWSHAVRRSGTCCRKGTSSLARTRRRNVPRLRLCLSPHLLSPLPAESPLPAVAEASAEQGGIPFTVDSMFRGGKIPCYAVPSRRLQAGRAFPVVYLLHGAFEDAGVWNTRAGALLSKLATRERLVFIAPSCGRTGWYADSPYLKKSRIESFFARELMPYVERAFPVLPKRGVMGHVDGGGTVPLSLRCGIRLLCLGQLHERRYGHYPASRSMEDPRRARPWRTPTRRCGSRDSAEDLLKRSKAAGMPAMLITTGQQDAYVVPENRALGYAPPGAGSPISTARRPASTTGRYWLDELPTCSVPCGGVASVAEDAEGPVVAPVSYPCTENPLLLQNRRPLEQGRVIHRNTKAVLF